MRRLGKHLSIYSLALFVSLILTFCSLVTLAHSNEVNASNSSQKGCNSSCASHGQPATISNLREQNDEDDKEPIPPLLYWQLTPIILSALYVAPFAFFFFVHKRKLILLTTQLRF